MCIDMFVFSLGQVNLLKALVLYTGIEYSSITFFILSASIQGENFIFSNIVGYN